MSKSNAESIEIQTASALACTLAIRSAIEHASHLDADTLLENELSLLNHSLSAALIEAEELLSCAVEECDKQHNSKTHSRNPGELLAWLYAEGTEPPTKP